MGASNIQADTPQKRGSFEWEADAPHIYPGTDPDICYPGIDYGPLCPSEQDNYDQKWRSVGRKEHTILRRSLAPFRPRPFASPRQNGLE